MNKLREHIKQGQYRNVLKCSKGKAESYEHKFTKFIIADYCWTNGLNFRTEVEFNNGGRADIVIEELGIGIEVLKSETIKKFNEKNYPVPVVPMRTNKSIVEIWNIMDDLVATKGTGADYYIRKFTEGK